MINQILGNYSEFPKNNTLIALWVEVNETFLPTGPCFIQKRIQIIYMLVKLTKCMQYAKHVLIIYPFDLHIASASAT